MQLMFWKIPSEEKRQALPPATITDDILVKTGLGEPKTSEQTILMTMLSHFAYGIGCGIIYSYLAPRVKGPASAGNLGPNTNWMMAKGHMLFGSTLGFAEEQLRRRGSSMLDARMSAS